MVERNLKKQFGKIFQRSLNHVEIIHRLNAKETKRTSLFFLILLAVQVGGRGGGSRLVYDAIFMVKFCFFFPFAACYLCN